jgi:hypothetical protein
MASFEQQLPNESHQANLVRHQAQCKICSSPHCQAIEEKWVNWGNTTQIADCYHFTRDAIYRHAHALNLFEKRQKNLKSALEKMIERLDMATITGPTILSAVKEYRKLTSEEEKAAPAAAPNLREILSGMSQAEREAFARDGSLPQGLLTEAGATVREAEEGGQQKSLPETERVQ